MTSAAPEGLPDPAATSALALAAAIRQQLSHPGSVSPQRQLELILADRLTPDPEAANAGRIRHGWTPFPGGVDPCPYRPLADGSWLTSDTP